jgi:uncharacterized protein YqfB (UPF0267 family)
MKIVYNKNENSIIIKDNLKSHYFTLKILLVLTIINSIIWTIKETNEYGTFVSLVWILIGITSLVLLILSFKKSTKERIPLNEIKSLKEKIYFGKKRFSLKLSNGKIRNILQTKNPKEIQEFERMMNDLGIRTE